MIQEHIPLIQGLQSGAFDLFLDKILEPLTQSDPPLGTMAIFGMHLDEQRHCPKKMTLREGMKRNNWKIY